MASLKHSAGRITLKDRSGQVILSQDFWWEEVSKNSIRVIPTRENDKEMYIHIYGAVVAGVKYGCNTDHILRLVNRFQYVCRECIIFAGPQYVRLMVYSSDDLIAQREIPYECAMKEVKDMDLREFGSRERVCLVLGHECSIPVAHQKAVCAVSMVDEPAAC